MRKFQSLIFVFKVQSQETERYSGNTGHLTRNLYIMLKFTKRRKTLVITSIITWLYLKEISCFQVIFLVIWMKKKTLIWFSLQRDGTGNGLPNIKDTFAESLQLQMLVLHQIMCIFKADGLSRSYDCQAKYKEKVPDVSDPNQMLKGHAIPNSSLHSLKVYSSKGCRKTNQR